jgi:hypothetical protein
VEIDAQPTTAIGWTFGSFVFEKAFQQLAKALRWMFWGLALQLTGAALALVPFLALRARNPNFPPQLVLPGIVLLSIGGIAMIIGEQKCLHLEAPFGMTRSLPGHGWLRSAYWCHLGSWLLRAARRWLPRGPLSLALLPLQAIGYVFLLLFLRKTADVLERHDLKRHVDAVFGLAAGMLLAAAFLIADRMLHLGMLRMLPRFVALGALVLPIMLLVATTLTYAILLWRMGSAAAGFARYLGAIDDPANSDEPAEMI